MSLFSDIYDLYFNVGTGEIGSVIEKECTIPAPEDSYEKSVILKRTGDLENKVEIILSALADFQPMVLNADGTLKLQTSYHVDSSVSAVWKDLLEVKEGGTNGSDERVKVLIQHTLSYCMTKYSMMRSGGDRLSILNGDLFRSVAKEVGDIRWEQDGTFYVTTDKWTRTRYIGINPLFVLRVIIETFLKQVYRNKVTNDVAGLEIIGKQVVCYLFLHEFSHIAYGHLDAITTHKEIFGEVKANYSFDSFINRNIENDEGWITPSNGISTAQYALIEAATLEGKFIIALTAFLTEGDLFAKIKTERALAHIPNSLIGAVPICGENPDFPSMEWAIKRNILTLMVEKQLFTDAEKQQFADKIDKNRPPKQKLGLEPQGSAEAQESTGDPLLDALNRGPEDPFRMREIPRINSSEDNQPRDDGKGKGGNVQSAELKHGEDDGLCGDGKSQAGGAPKVSATAASEISNSKGERPDNPDNQVDMTEAEIEDMMTNILKANSGNKALTQAIEDMNQLADESTKIDPNLKGDEGGKATLASIPTAFVSSIYDGNMYRKFAKLCKEQRERYAIDEPSRKVIGLWGRNVEVTSNSKFKKVLFIIDLSASMDKNILSVAIAKTMIEMLKIDKKFQSDVLGYGSTTHLIERTGSKREMIYASLNELAGGSDKNETVLTLCVNIDVASTKETTWAIQDQ